MFYNFLFAFSFLITIVCGPHTIIYIKRGETVELCDNRSTIIFAYEYRSFDSKINLIIEPSKDSRYSNPYGTSLLRINNVNDDDSGLYKCPQDDIEWQRLQVYGKFTDRMYKYIYIYLDLIKRQKKNYITS